MEGRRGREGGGRERDSPAARLMVRALLTTLPHCMQLLQRASTARHSVRPHLLQVCPLRQESWRRQVRGTGS